MPYATLQELRDEGVTVDQASDTRLTDLIDEATEYIDLMTKRWFEPKTKTLKLDGTGHDTLWFNIPIITISTVNIEGQVIDPGDYAVYNRPEDRNLPKIVGPNFPKGALNIEVAGEFGYVEELGATPRIIKKACRMLVIRELPKLMDQDGQEEKKRGRIVSESTDGHSYTLSEARSSQEFTGDPEIDNLIYSFRSPPVVGSA